MMSQEYRKCSAKSRLFIKAETRKPLWRGFPGMCKPVDIIPTRCRYLWLKQIRLVNVVPAILIILIAHIVLAVRWMLIKILSAMINHHRRVNTVVSGGCHPNSSIIILCAKSTEKSRCCRSFFAPIIPQHYIELSLDCCHPVCTYTAINQIRWWSFLPLLYREVSQ